MNDEYVKALESIGLKPTNADLNASEHQELACLLCDSTFTATPKSKINNFKKTQMKGCPKCTLTLKYAEADKKNEQRLKDMGYILLEPYNGLKGKILVSNPTCKCGGTPWSTTPEHIFTGRSYCAPCNTKRKSELLKQLNINLHR